MSLLRWPNPNAQARARACRIHAGQRDSSSGPPRQPNRNYIRKKTKNPFLGVIFDVRFFEGAGTISFTADFEGAGTICACSSVKMESCVKLSVDTAVMSTALLCRPCRARVSAADTSAHVCANPRRMADMLYGVT